MSLWSIAILVVLCGAFTAMLDVRPWVVALIIFGQLVFFGLAPFFFEWNNIDTYGLPAFGWLGGWVLAYAATGATLAIHLSVHVIDQVAETLIPHYGADGAVAVVVRASWPEEVIIRATLSTIGDKVRVQAIERTALILVGPALAAHDFADSALYSADYDRRFRPSAESGRGRT